MVHHEIVRADCVYRFVFESLVEPFVHGLLLLKTFPFLFLGFYICNDRRIAVTSGSITSFSILAMFQISRLEL